MSALKEVTDVAGGDEITGRKVTPKMKDVASTELECRKR
jgi:hypothetical protein